MEDPIFNPNISWNMLSMNPNLIPLLEQYPKKILWGQIDWRELSGNSKARPSPEIKYFLKNIWIIS